MVKRKEVRALDRSNRKQNLKKKLKGKKGRVKKVFYKDAVKKKNEVVEKEEVESDGSEQVGKSWKGSEEGEVEGEDAGGGGLKRRRRVAEED